MKIDIYRSATDCTKYLSVPAGTDVTEFAFPKDLDKDLRTLSPFKTQHEIIPGRPYVALDAKDVARQIKERGFAVHGAKVTITVSSGGKQR